MMATVSGQAEKPLIHTGSVEKTIWCEQKQKKKKNNFKDRFAFRISILLKLHDFEEINFSELVLWYLFFIQ